MCEGEVEGGGELYHHCQYALVGGIKSLTVVFITSPTHNSDDWTAHSHPMLNMEEKQKEEEKLLRPKLCITPTFFLSFWLTSCMGRKSVWLRSSLFENSSFWQKLKIIFLILFLSAGI